MEYFELIYVIYAFDKILNTFFFLIQYYGNV